MWCRRRMLRIPWTAHRNQPFKSTVNRHRLALYLRLHHHLPSGVIAAKRSINITKDQPIDIETAQNIRRLSTCLQRILEYFGHIARREVEGKRPRGRSSIVRKVVT
ncbi:jg20140 [Pararge aegeria aegeria]|uniref:Jg20140 protein n=1 Tax=Pararge aegeria aegeria TaxID=348720 RepID=A0A8S4SDG9_9NEOP|nr:jg20140 [Pararge aegeria aegeria]